MWYDQAKIRMIFFLGAAIVLCGLGLVMMDHRVPGAVLICFGIAMVIIAFAVLRMHMMIKLKRR